MNTSTVWSSCWPREFRWIKLSLHKAELVCKTWHLGCGMWKIRFLSVGGGLAYIFMWSFRFNPHSPCSGVFRVIFRLFGVSYAALGISKSNDVQLEVSDVRWHTRKFEDSAAHMLALDRLCEAGWFCKENLDWKLML